jgi:hypothetical protein
MKPKDVGNHVREGGGSMSDEEQVVLVPDEVIEAGAQPGQMRQVDAGTVELMTRLLVGLSARGSGELLRRLEDLQAEVLADPGLVPHDTTAGVDSPRDALRYLAISLLLRGQRQVTRSVRSAFDRSVDTARWAVRTLDRLSNTPLVRPLRRPAASRSRRWEETITLLIQEGKREEQVSKVLAGRSVSMIIDEVVDLVTQNPELDRLIAEIVGQKSVGLATVVADNARSLSAAADDVTDGALRRLLRRTPRRDLAPSPLWGQPQTMYAPEKMVEGEGTDGG